MSPARTLLIVEDDPDIQDYYGILLAELGANIVRAGTGREGLAVIDGGDTVDLVLLDIVLPEMNGEEFFRELRVKRSNQVPVIVCSVDERLVEPLRGIGPLQGVFLKGESGDGLVRMVRDLLPAGQAGA